MTRCCPGDLASHFRVDKLDMADILFTLSLVGGDKSCLTTISDVYISLALLSLVACDKYG